MGFKVTSAPANFFSNYGKDTVKKGPTNMDYIDMNIKRDGQSKPNAPQLSGRDLMDQFYGI